MVFRMKKKRGNPYKGHIIEEERKEGQAEFRKIRRFMIAELKSQSVLHNQS